MGLNRLRRRFEPVIRRVMHFYWRFSRAATLGVRAMVIDGNDRIFLVKHSYVDGWHLPGGGVETGESLLEALARELAEEGNILLGSFAAALRLLLQQARVTSRPRRDVRRSRLSAGREAETQSRNHCARLLSERRAA